MTNCSSGLLCVSVVTLSVCVCASFLFVFEGGMCDLTNQNLIIAFLFTLVIRSMAT